MSIFDEVFEQLQGYLTQVDTRFMQPFSQAYEEDMSLNLLEFEFEIKTYCILTHAAFEEYFEQISKLIANSIYLSWMENKKVTKLTVIFIHNNNINFSARKETIVDNYIKGLLAQAKNKFETLVKSNHGLTEKHLLDLFGAVGIEIVSYTNALNSIVQLSKARNEFAHNSTRTQTLFEPSEYRKWVTECIQLCDAIRKQANELTN